MPFLTALLRLVAVWLFLFASVVFSSSFNLKDQNQLIPGVEHYRLLVKFQAAVVQDVAAQKVMFVNNPPPAEASAILAAQSLVQQFTYRQVVQFNTAEKLALKHEQIPPVAPGHFDYFAYRGMAYVVEAETLNADAVLALAKKFEQLEVVEYAALEPLEPMTPPSATPDLTTYQHYRAALYTAGSDVVGINAEYAWQQGISGQGVQVADIEWGFNYQHEDLAGDNFLELISTTNNDYDNHGTAVAGIMIARDNGYGMKGMVHGVDNFFGVSEIRYGRVAGIMEGLRQLTAGDVFLYEMQTGGRDNQFVPADFNQAVWDVTKSATDAGVIVVAAAGNGSEDLDDAYYESYRARGDNGSIVVGAGTKVGRNRASFSTYGSPVHLQGWGDWSVATTGYGNLHNGGPDETYTAGFSGTSAATPIVASAVVAVQSWYKREFNNVLAPRDMRALLISTGTLQGAGGHIGPLPNIQAAIEQLRDEYNQRVVVAPVTLSASNVMQYSFSLSWQSVPQAIGYKVRVATDSAFSNLVAGYQSVDVGNNTSLQITNLNPASSYYLQVQAYNDQHFSDYSEPLLVNTAALEMFWVTANAMNGGGLTPQQQQVVFGQTATVTLIADQGYRIDEVSGCGGTLNDNIYTTAPVSGNCSITATFSLINNAGGSRYTYLANGSIVHDEVTGLQWQRCSVGQSWTGSQCFGVASRFSWQEAMNLVVPAGFSVPDFSQLRSLVYCSNLAAYDSGGSNQACGVIGSFQNPTIDLQAFPNTPSNAYWSADTFEQAAELAWFVDLHDGHANNGSKLNTMSIRLIKTPGFVPPKRRKSRLLLLIMSMQKNLP